MYLVLQQDKPDDHVIATGEQYRVRKFVTRAFAEIGLGLVIRGTGVDEQGILDSVDEALLSRVLTGEYPATVSSCETLKPGMVLVRVDRRYFRPCEVSALLGDASKARRYLGWEPSVPFPEIVRDMVLADLAGVRRETFTVEGETTRSPHEQIRRKV